MTSHKMLLTINNKFRPKVQHRWQIECNHVLLHLSLFHSYSKPFYVLYHPGSCAFVSCLFQLTADEKRFASYKLSFQHWLVVVSLVLMLLRLYVSLYKKKKGLFDSNRLELWCNDMTMTWRLWGRAGGCPPGTSHSKSVEPNVQLDIDFHKTADI